MYYNTHAWFRIDRNHRNILFVVVFIHFELRFYVLERYFRTHFEILDHFVSKSNLTYSVNYYDIFSDLTLSVFYWILLNFKMYWIYWISRGFYWISQPRWKVQLKNFFIPWLNKHIYKMVISLKDKFVTYAMPKGMDWWCHIHSDRVRSKFLEHC